MNNEKFLKTMLDFTQEAGVVALSLINTIQPELKKDHSIVTEADKSISALARQKLSALLKSPDHIMIDEEDPASNRYLNQSLLNKVPYIWSVDPIDGTRSFANQMPLYGISIGLIKNLKPWLGVLYLPSLKELFFCDGENAYFVENAFTRHEKKITIVPNHEELSHNSIFFCSETIINEFAWDTKDCHVMMPACAVIDLGWPTIGRGVGCILRSYLWDFAGAWPIFQAAGLKFRSITSGRAMEALDATLFNQTNAPWKMLEYHILSSEENFPLLKERLKVKD